MRVAAPFRIATEARLVAMARILDHQPPAILIDAKARQALYAAAALPGAAPVDDAEAARRSLLFRVGVAARPATVAA